MLVLYLVDLLSILQVMVVTPGDSGPAINVAIWILFGFATVAIILRINARTRRNHQLGWDDYIMCLALVGQRLSQVSSS